MRYREALALEHILLASFAITITIALNGCAGTHSNSTPDFSWAMPDSRAKPVDSQPARLQFPPSAANSLPPRQSNSTSLVEFTGVEYINASGEHNYRPEGTDDYVIVSEDANSQAWAIYGLNAPADQRPVEITLNVWPAAKTPTGDPKLPLQYWCAVSNYTRYSWEWWGPLTGEATIQLNSESHRDRYVSSTDELYIAVLATVSPDLITEVNPAGSTAADIRHVTVTSKPVADPAYYSTRPHYPLLTVADVNNGEQPAVQLNWIHVTDSASEENEASEYRVYRLGPGDAGKLPLGTVNAPETMFLDPANNSEQVIDLIVGLHYTYYLVAANSAGITPAGTVRTQIPPAIPGQNQLVITAYEVRIAYATGGRSASNDVFGPGALNAEITANADTALELASICGVFNGSTFQGSAPATWPQALTTAYYSAALTAASDGLYWYLQNKGAADSRRCSDCLVLDSGVFPITGEPGSATVYSDYDPESDSSNAEGRLLTYLPSSSTWDYLDHDDLRVHVVYELQYAIDIDVLPDPSAATLLDYLTPAGEPLTHLLTDSPTEVMIEFSWGDGGIPHQMNEATICLYQHMTMNGFMALISEFVFSEIEPLPGEFCIVTEDHAIYIVCPEGIINQSAQYAFRFSANDKWSTINLPNATLSATTSGSAPDVIIFPTQCSPSTDELQILRQDPRVRRNPCVTYDYESGYVKPVDFLGYYDTLKPNGDEFLVYYENGMYPRVAIIEGTDPALIHSWEDCLPGIFTFNQNPNNLWIDIAAITPAGNPDDPIRYYSYRVFNQSGSSAGDGTFTIGPVDPPLVKPQGVAWGVNSFNRIDRLLSERNYTDHSIDADTVFWDSPMPDVLWFEVLNGWMFDHNQDSSGVFDSAEAAATDNLLIAVKDSLSGSQCYLSASTRIVLLSEPGAYLFIHALTPSAFKNSAETDWPGILSPGHEYILSLDDPHWLGIEYEFSDKLTITGTNPNDL